MSEGSISGFLGGEGIDPKSFCDFSRFAFNNKSFFDLCESASAIAFRRSRLPLISSIRF